MLKKYFLTAVIVALPLGPVFAQYQGPGGDGSSMGRTGYTATTVGAIKSDPRDDMRVLLEGRLIRKIKHETYIFADSTGEIAVEIDDDDFPRSPVTADTVVVVEGKVDTHRIKDTDIEAERVSIKR